MDEQAQGNHYFRSHIDLEAWRQYVDSRSDQMTLEEFGQFWEVPDRKIYMEICGCAKSVVDHWFSTGDSHVPPTRYHQRRLAEAHHHFMALQTMPHRFPVLYFRIISADAAAS